MDVHFALNGADFVWDEDKARANVAAHSGITFERAAEVFFDPLFRLVDASRNDEARDAVIGYDTSGRLLFVVHIQVEDELSASFLPARPLPRNVRIMSIPSRLKARLRKDRPMISITLRVPEDVVESLKVMAPLKGFSGYQALLKAYISDGLRRDEAIHAFGPAARLAEALRKRGVPAELIEDAVQEAALH